MNPTCKPGLKMNPNIKKNLENYDVVDPRDKEEMMEDAKEWMLAATIYLTPKQISEVINFADKLGKTYWQFWCLPWGMWGSLKNPDARYYLSHALFPRTEANKTAYDTWHAISYFLLTHLKIAGSFAEMFKWNTGEILFRIGGTYKDLMELTRRDVSRTAIDVFGDGVATKTFTQTIENALYDDRLDAAIRFCDASPPVAKKSNKEKFSFDMGIDGPTKLDYGAYESDSLDAIESPPADKYTSWRRIMRSKSNSTYETPEKKTTATEVTVTKGSIEQLLAVAPPPSPVESVATATATSDEHAVMTFSDSPKTNKGELKKVDPSPLKDTPSTVFESPPSESAKFHESPQVKKSDGKEEALKFGSAKKPIEFVDSPPAIRVLNWWEQRAKNYKPLGKKKKQKNQPVKRLQKYKKPAPANKPIKKRTPFDCGLKLTPNGSFICDSDSD